MKIFFNTFSTLLLLFSVNATADVLSYNDVCKSITDSKMKQSCYDVTNIRALSEQGSNACSTISEDAFKLKCVLDVVDQFVHHTVPALCGIENSAYALECVNVAKNKLFTETEVTDAMTYTDPRERIDQVIRSGISWVKPGQSKLEFIHDLAVKAMKAIDDQEVRNARNYLESIERVSSSQ